MVQRVRRLTPGYPLTRRRYGSMLPYHVSGVGCFAGSLPSRLLFFLLQHGSWLSPASWPAPIRCAHLCARCPCIGRASHAALWDRRLVAEVGAAAPRRRPVHTRPYTSLLGASFKPDVAGRACISGGDRIAKAQTTSRGRVAMGLFWKSKKQKEASRSRAPGYHATTPPRLLNP